MLRDKIQMIHEPHGLFQTRMEQGAGEAGGRQICDAIGQPESRPAELSQNLIPFTSIVIGFMSLAIRQVRDGERASAP